MLSILVVCSSASAELPAPIVNGLPTGVGQFPGVVALVDGTEEFCTGTLIQKRWVLTAAHCVANGTTTYSDDRMKAVFGDSVDGADDAIAWKASYSFPGYNPGALTGDVALIELVEPKYGVRAMVLNDLSVDASWSGVPLTFVGFGVTGDSRSDSGIKRFTQIPIKDFDPSTVISFDASTNVCFGDSGGAALVETADGFEIVGVNSYVTPNCQGGENGAARVDAHLSWILEHVPYALLDPRVPPPEAEADALVDLDVGDDAGIGDWTGNLDTDGTASTPGGCSTGPGVGSVWLFALALLAPTLRGPGRR